MKILRGNFKGRNIKATSNIRPLALRVRKACFDILDDEIQDKVVLDLFAGSGALGIESLSCGARKAVFVDLKKACVDTIKKNLTLFRLMPLAQICLKDAFAAVKDFHAKGIRFDIIFIDPPYYKGMLKKALQALDKYDILAPSGYIVGFCYSKDSFIQEGTNFSLILHKKYGQTSVFIYKKNEESNLSRDI